MHNLNGANGYPEEQTEKQENDMMSKLIGVFLDEEYHIYDRDMLN